MITSLKQTETRIQAKDKIEPQYKRRYYTSAGEFIEWRAITAKRGDWLSVIFLRLLSCWLSVDSGAIWSFAGPAIFVISVGVHN